nr:hypothetical protein [Tanacetum cinerariifolium]
MHNEFPLPVMEFPLPREVPTTSEESSHCQKKREATAVKIALLLKSRRNCQSKSDNSYTNAATTGTASDGTGTKKGRTVTVTAEDMQKRKNDVKARTTLLLSLLDEHQLRFTEGSETLEQTFNRLQDINQIDEDDIEKMDIKWNMALLSMRADRFWKKTGKKISIQGTDVAGFDKSKVECFNYHKMGHFTRECRALRSQDRGRRDNYRQVSKVEKQALKALMEIDRVGWDWSYMANDEENHALIADEETPTKFALMAKTSDESKELESLKKEKEGLDGKLAGFQTASKDLDSLLESQRLDKNKEGLGYNVVPPPPAQIYSSLDCPTNSKTDKAERAKKPPVNKRVKNETSRSQNTTHKSFTPRPVIHKPYRPPMRPMRSNMNERSGDDAPIKGKNLDEGEAAAERVSDDTEEMAIVLTSMDTSTVLASGVAEVSTSSGSIPTAGPSAAEIPTGSDVVPTAGLIFATSTVVTPYTRRKGKETTIEFETPKKKKVQEQIDTQVVRELEGQMAREDQRMSERVARDVENARIHAEEELQIMIDGLDRINETVAKYLHEYHQFASELSLERRIELISDLVSYQDNYAKVHKYQSQQGKPWSKKKKRDYYMDVIKSNLVISKDKEIFMLVEKDYPLRKGLAFGMISYNLQVKTYSKMGNDLILKIYKIASSPRQQGD